MVSNGMEQSIRDGGNPQAVFEPRLDLPQQNCCTATGGTPVPNLIEVS